MTGFKCSASATTLAFSSGSDVVMTPRQNCANVNGAGGSSLHGINVEGGASRSRTPAYGAPGGRPERLPLLTAPAHQIPTTTAERAQWFPSEGGDRRGGDAAATDVLRLTRSRVKRGPTTSTGFAEKTKPVKELIMCM
ncbi:hypothetical protein GW17_00027795 [Ensete ventricosum]|nr:hypothetical protein GW17_00027795 [Ensete ventricosum]RZR80381.1 hypothetical protein BHM03_00006409 [Ensete ventricosum]